MGAKCIDDLLVVAALEEVASLRTGDDRGLLLGRWAARLPLGLQSLVHGNDLVDRCEVPRQNVLRMGQQELRISTNVGQLILRSSLLWDSCAPLGSELPHRQPVLVAIGTRSPMHLRPGSHPVVDPLDLDHRRVAADSHGELVDELTGATEQLLETVIRQEGAAGATCAFFLCKVWIKSAAAASSLSIPQCSLPSRARLTQIGPA